MIVTALFGDPVDHSTSPKLYSFFAKHFNLEYAHIKIRIDSKRANSLLGGLRSVRNLNFAGVNVTLPFKQKVLKLLDRVNPKAKRIGAVNTIVNKNDILIGYNTDGIGAIRAIENGFRKITPRDYVTVLGSGGAARAIVWEIIRKCPNVVVLNQAKDFFLARSLLRDFHARQSGLNIDLLTKRNLIKQIGKSTLVINATSAGMFPHSNNSPIPQEVWGRIPTSQPIKKKYFFDAIFNPLQTKFLRKAKNKGAKICSGMDMMVFQGAEAFELWTGNRPTHGLVKTAIKYMHTTVR